MQHIVNKHFQEEFNISSMKRLDLSLPKQPNVFQGLKPFKKKKKHLAGLFKIV